MTCQALFNGGTRRLDKISATVSLKFNEQDTHLLYVLKDITGSRHWKHLPSRKHFLELWRS